MTAKKTAELLARLLEVKADREDRDTALWEQDPDAHSDVTPEDIAKYQGKAEGLREAAGLIREYLVEGEEL